MVSESRLERSSFDYDTTGFNQAAAKGENPLSPYEQAHDLLRNLQDGVDLILLCARRDGINASLRNLCWLLNKFFFDGHAPTALTLTHFDTLPQNWWEENKTAITNGCDMPETIPDACITTVQSARSDTVYDRSKQLSKALLLAPVTTPTPLCLDLSSIPAAAEGLSTRCGLSLLDATALVEKFSLPRRLYHETLFGDAGVGKSPIIVLLAGYRVAEVSSGVGLHTLDSCSYDINTGLHQLRV